MLNDNSPRPGRPKPWYALGRGERFECPKQGLCCDFPDCKGEHVILLLVFRDVDHRSQEGDLVPFGDQ